jgi:hypothetical protein
LKIDNPLPTNNQVISDNWKDIMIRVCSILVGGTITALLISANLYAQSPLTIQPSTGRVGVGTTIPNVKFQVGGPSTTLGNSGTWPMWVSAGNDNDRIMFASSGTGASQFGVVASASGGTWTNTVINPNGGNVGVGTTSPAGKLHVAGDLKVTDGNAHMYGSGERGLFLYSTSHTKSVAVVTDNGGGAPSIQLSQDASLSARSWLLSVYPDNRLAIVHPGEGDKVTITTGGNVGIGTPSPTSLLHVNGTLTATSKNFQIDHPLEPDKKLLVHSALEGPEVAVYYRGEAQLVNGEAVISLPSYFEALTRKENRTVQLTSIKGWAPLYVADEIEDGRFAVRTGDGGNSNQRFYWEVKAVRADVAPLIVEKDKTETDMKVVQTSAAAAQ